MAREIGIPIEAEVRVGGFLDIPADAKGLVLFVHGSGSSRFSRRNQEEPGALEQVADYSAR